MPLPQSLLERCMQISRTRVSAIIKIARQQILILFDNLINQRPMRCCNRGKISIARFLSQHINHIRRAVRRQIKHHALLTKTLTNICHQPRQIEILRINLVHHNHPAQLTLSRLLHHALGHQLDTCLRIDHN